MTGPILNRRDFSRLLAGTVLVAGNLAVPAFAADGKRGATLRVVASSESPSFVDLFGNGAIPAVQG